MITVDIPAWSGVDHNAPEQLKRIISARKIKAGGVRHIGENEAEITGSSGVYHVAPDSCSCPDFAQGRGLRPCKHVYRLALDMGLVGGLPDESAAAWREVADAETARLRALWFEGRIPSDKFAALLNALK